MTGKVVKRQFRYPINILNVIFLLNSEDSRETKVSNWNLSALEIDGLKEYEKKGP